MRYTDKNHWKERGSGNAVETDRLCIFHFLVICEMNCRILSTLYFCADEIWNLAFNHMILIPQFMRLPGVQADRIKATALQAYFLLKLI